MLPILNQTRTWFLEVTFVSLLVCLCLMCTVHPKAINNYWHDFTYMTLDDGLNNSCCFSSVLFYGPCHRYEAPINAKLHPTSPGTVDICSVEHAKNPPLRKMFSQFLKCVRYNFVQLIT